MAQLEPLEFLVTKSLVELMKIEYGSWLFSQNFLLKVSVLKVAEWMSVA